MQYFGDDDDLACSTSANPTQNLCTFKLNLPSHFSNFSDG